MVGSSTREQQVAWSERDSMLYAVGVGAGLGDPARELAFTTENSAGITLQTIPSFVTVVAAGQPPAMTALDTGRFLHAGQHIELARPIPASGCGTLVSTIVEVLDKGSDAIVTYETILRCAGDGAEPTGRTRTTVFVRGGGGFGGARGAPRLIPMDARFSRPAYPGQTLTTEIWIDAPDRMSFCTLNDAGETVLDGGTARLTWEACGVHSNT